MQAVHGYAAFEHVSAAEIHAAQQQIARRQERAPEPEAMAVIVDPDGAGQGWSLLARLRDAWADAREVWAQTTFYVLDPNSWG